MVLEAISFIMTLGYAENWRADNVVTCSCHPGGSRRRAPRLVSFRLCVLLVTRVSSLYRYRSGFAILKVYTVGKTRKRFNEICPFGPIAQGARWRRWLWMSTCWWRCCRVRVEGRHRPAAILWLCVAFLRTQASSVSRRRACHSLRCARMCVGELHVDFLFVSI